MTTVSKHFLIIIPTLSLLCCLSSTGHGQPRKQTGTSAPKLELVATVVDSTYCSASNVRLTLQLSFHNVGSQRILLRKDGFRVGRYQVSKDAQQLGTRKYELNVAPMMNSVGILKYQLEGKPTTGPSAFVTLEPDATHSVNIQLNIPFVEVGNQATKGTLAGGDHVLQILVWTWLDSESFAARLHERWKNRGYLWTKSIASKPISFTVMRKRLSRDVHAGGTLELLMNARTC